MATPRENDLGAVRCPVCSGTAHRRLSANGRPYLVMDCCKAQLFSRGDLSDTLLRALPAPVKAEPPAAPKIEPKQPAAVPTPAPVAKTSPAPVVPAPVPPVAPPTAPGWGVFGW